MQFRKISDTKIHCVITKEEMWEKGIEIDDFLDHREKTEAFLREVLAEAKYELDLEDIGHFCSVQMSVMPEGDVSLVISGERSSSVGGALEEFGKRLEDFKEVMNQAKKKLEEKKSQTDEETTEEKSQTVKGMQSVWDTPIWVRIPTMDRCILLAKQLVQMSKVGSALFKYDDAYYLQLIFLHEEHQVAGTVLVVSEFAEDIFSQDQGGVLVLEHATPILKEDAVEILASL